MDRLDAEGYGVVWPLAPKRANAVVPTQRDTTLSGSRVGFIWDYLFWGDEMWEETKTQIRAKFSDVSFVDHDVFGNVHGPDEAEVIDALPGVILSTGVSSVVVAVGA